jgi:hypothetical protein
MWQRSQIGHALSFFFLASEEYFLQLTDLAQKSLSAPTKGHYFCHLASRSEKVTHFIKGLAESLGRFKFTKTHHRIVSMLDAPVALLDSVSPTGKHLVLNFFP